MGTLRVRGVIRENAPEVSNAMLDLWKLCEERGVDYQRAVQIAEGIANGAFKGVEAINLVMNHVKASTCQDCTPSAKTEKRCPRCGETKPVEDFHRHRKRADGRQAICKVCHATHYRKSP